MSITEIVSDCQQIGTGALLIIGNYILSLLWGNQCFFSFDSHSKHELGRMSTTGTAVLLRFGSLYSLENYIKSVYYSNYSMTLYFLVQFSKLKCIENTKSLIKSALKSERKKKVSSLKKKSKTREKRYKQPVPEFQSQEDSIEKGNTREILNKKNNIKQRNIRKILGQRKNMKKKKHQENPEPRREHEKIYICGKSPTKKRISKKLI